MEVGWGRGKGNILAGWLVEDEDAALLEKRPPKTKQLSLAVREKGLVHLLVERVLARVVDFQDNDVPDGGPLQRADDGLVRVDAQRIGVEADRVGEEERVLGEAAELLADERLGHPGDVLAVEQDLAGGHVGHAEEGLDEGALAAAAAADEADLLAGLDGEGDVVENGVGGGAVE